MPSSSPTSIAANELQELLKRMGVEAEVSANDETPPILEIKSPEAASLIGHRGDGLKSLQHILRLIMVRKGGEGTVLIDIEGYRDRQHQQLQELAKRKADEVMESGRLAVLQPMSSYERRLVHTALAEREGVTTESIGDGGQRRVMIKKAE